MMWPWFKRPSTAAGDHRQAVLRLGRLAEQTFTGKKMEPRELRKLGLAMRKYPELLEMLQGGAAMVDAPEAKEGFNAILARAQAAARS